MDARVGVIALDRGGVGVGATTEWKPWSDSRVGETHTFARLPRNWGARAVATSVGVVATDWVELVLGGYHSTWKAQFFALVEEGQAG